MAGAVGSDGEALLNTLRDAGVDTRFVHRISGPSGSALIQIADDGANAIIVSGGANHAITEAMIEETLAEFDAGDMLLLQNEISNVAVAIKAAKARGLTVAFNPSPVSGGLAGYPLEAVDIFILNEIEGQTLARMDESAVPGVVLEKLHALFPRAAIALTLGKAGVLYRDAGTACSHGSYRVRAVDTTAAGDTFCGYFLACAAKGMAVEKALEYACKASGIAVSRKGAAASIPLLSEVEHAALPLA
jgi:ribokinase